MYNMAALLESKSLKNVGVITERTFLQRYFSMKIDTFLELLIHRL